MNNIFLFLIIFLKISGCYAADDEPGAPYSAYPESILLFYACTGQIRTTGTYCDPMTAPLNCTCTNNNLLGSIMQCYENLDQTSDSDIQNLADDCRNVYFADITVEDIKEAHDYYTENVQDVASVNFTEVLDFPVTVEKDTSLLYKAAYDQYLGTYNTALFYASALLGYWLLVLIIASCGNWMKRLFPGVTKSLVGPISNGFRKHITLPALVKRKTQAKTFGKVFGLIIPSRAETVILIGFVMVAIACVGANIKAIPNDPIFSSSRNSLGRQLGVRAGIVASLLMPLLILFGGRNNFLQWITGWNFATFVTFHRWIARVLVLILIIHASGYTINFQYKEGYVANMKVSYVKWGVMSLTTGSIMLVQGMLYLRRKWYELFLFCHIVLAAVFVGGAWSHTNTIGYVWLYYAATAVWIFDRTVRVGRLLAFGFPKSEIVLVGDETVKVTVPKPKYWKAIPGGHAFVHFLNPKYFWQSHPFTFTQSEDGTKIIFHCKIKGGITHSLCKQLMTTPGKVGQLRVAIEGPYGESTPAKKYDSAVFIAGGNGIPGVYSEVCDLAKSNNDNQKLKLIWIIREYKSLQWFYDEVIALKGTKVEASIYVTRPELNSGLEEFNNKLQKVDSNNEESDEAEKSAEDKINEESKDFSYQRDNVINSIKSELDHITFKENRPCIEEIIKQETEESVGSIAFVTCGHPMMVDDVRYSVVENMDKTKKRMDFFEQLQVWA